MHYRITSATGQVLDEGDGRAALEGGVISVSPTLGQPLLIRPVDVTDITEPAPFTIRLRLAEGAAVDLSQMGVLRTQILEQFRAARVEDTTSSLLLVGVGKPEIFPGALGDVDAELRLYDDALVAVPVSGPPEQVPYAFVEDVTTDPSGYVITVDLGEGRTIVVKRLARRTSEFLDFLRTRVTKARGRTGSFLQALLPGLTPLGLRSTAGLLRDGMAARKTDLDGVDPTIWPVLVDRVALSDRRPCVDALARMGELSIGFKQMVTVEHAATGDPTPGAQPVQVVTDHGGVPTMPGGLAGAYGSAMVMGGPPQVGQMGMGFDAPFGGGAMGSMMAMGMLGMGPMSGSMGGGIMGGEPFTKQMEAKPRADVERGREQPASTDLTALTATGGAATDGAPAVLAFVLAQTGNRIVYEVLNMQDHATYVYDSAAVSRRDLNRALVLLGMHVEPIYQQGSGAGARYRAAVERLPYLQAIRGAFKGRAIHTDGWEQQLRAL